MSYLNDLLATAAGRTVAAFLALALALLVVGLVLLKRFSRTSEDDDAAPSVTEPPTQRIPQPAAAPRQRSPQLFSLTPSSVFVELPDRLPADALHRGSGVTLVLPSAGGNELDALPPWLGELLRLARNEANMRALDWRKVGVLVPTAALEGVAQGSETRLEVNADWVRWGNAVALPPAPTGALADELRALVEAALGAPVETRPRHEEWGYTIVPFMSAAPARVMCWGEVVYSRAAGFEGSWEPLPRLGAFVGTWVIVVPFHDPAYLLAFEQARVVAAHVVAQANLGDHPTQA